MRIVKYCYWVENYWRDRKYTSYIFDLWYKLRTYRIIYANDSKDIIYLAPYSYFLLDDTDNGSSQITHHPSDHDIFSFQSVFNFTNTPSVTSHYFDVYQ